MTVWWLRGYYQGIYNLQYSAFTTYGECRAKQAQEELQFPEHTFKITKGWL